MKKKIKSKYVIMKISDTSFTLKYKQKNKIEKLHFQTFKELDNFFNFTLIDTSRFIVSIGHHNCIIKEIRLRADDFDQAVKMASFELYNLVPLDPENYTYAVLPKDFEPGDFAVKVFFLPRHKLDETLKLCRRLDFRVDQLVVDMDQLDENVDDKYFKQFNLLPVDTINLHKNKMILKKVFTSLACLILFALSLWLMLFSFNYRHAQKMRFYNEQIKPIENIATAVDSKKQIINALKSQLAGRDQILSVFNELYQYTPKDIFISDIKITQSYPLTSISIHANTQNLSNAFGYVENIRRSNLLKNINIEKIQQNPLPNDSSSVEFEMKCEIEKVKT